MDDKDKIIALRLLMYSLSKRNVSRLYECYKCKFLDQCKKTVSEPEDNEDGTCKTRLIFSRKEPEGG